MKNKLCYILLGVLMCFSFMGNVFADDLKFTVTATPDVSNVVKGKEVTITLNLKSDSLIDVCQFKVSSDSTLEYVSMSAANGWKVGEGAINNFILENDNKEINSLTNGENVMLFKYIVNGDGKVTIKTVECAYAENSNTSYSGTHDDVVVDIIAKDLSDDYTLSNLEVTGGTLLTSITPTVENLSVKLDSSTFGLSATASNPDYQDKIVFKDESGNIISDPSNMTFVNTGQSLMKLTITVNEQKTYNLIVIYEQTELDNTLKSITINGVSLNLEKDVYEYEYTIGKDVTSFDVSAVLSDSTNFKIGDDSNAPGNFSIKDFVDIVIVVEPVSTDIGASINTYTVRVTKEGAVVDDSSNKSEEDDKTSTGGATGGSSSSGSSSSSGNVSSNPTTGDISMFIMAVILIASLIGSIFLYQKNLKNYE